MCQKGGTSGTKLFPKIIYHGVNKGGIYSITYSLLCRVKARVQYDFMPIPLQMSTSDKCFFFKGKRQTILVGVVIYAFLPSEEWLSLILTMRESPSTGTVSLRPRLGCA